jgi:hypothetical protein
MKQNEVQLQLISVLNEIVETKKPKPTKEEAVALLWKRGNLSWKLDKTQRELAKFYKESKHKITTLICSRQLGKSFTLLILANEQCLKKPNSIVKYVSPKQSQSKKIIRPIMRMIIDDCPKSVRPIFKTQENIWRYPNGSEIQLAGTDGGHAENIRGGYSNLCIVDEAGTCNDLDYVIKSILMPTTITTKGRIIMATTPPRAADHEFNIFWEEAEFNNSLKFKTIYDSARLTSEEIEEIIRDNGGPNSPSVRREYFCEKIIDEDVTVIPEFTPELYMRIVKDWPRPRFFNTYVSGDIGFKDLTVILFAYIDFKNSKLIIEDELVMNGPKMTTESLAEHLIQKETNLWGDIYTKEHKDPYMRVCDNNLILINDLYRLHDITFLPAQKDDAEAAINSLRIALSSEKIIINPRCKILLRHLKNGRWNKQRTTYVRSPDDGHYDAIDAIKYLHRHVDYNKNPYPLNYDITDRANTYLSGYYQETSPLLTSIKNIFTVKPTVKRSKSKINK